MSNLGRNRTLFISRRIRYIIIGKKMEFIRQVIDSNLLEPVLHLPPAFQDTQVEVIVLPIGDSKPIKTVSYSHHGSEVPVKPVKHSAFGRLSAYANPSLIPEEKGAWEKAAAEKYAIH